MPAPVLTGFNAGAQHHCGRAMGRIRRGVLGNRRKISKDAMDSP